MAAGAPANTTRAVNSVSDAVGLACREGQEPGAGDKTPNGVAIVRLICEPKGSAAVGRVPPAVLLPHRV
jgi:hypothetical protein